MPKGDGPDSLPSCRIVDDRNVGSFQYLSTSLLQFARRITQPAVGSPYSHSCSVSVHQKKRHSHGRLEFRTGVMSTHSGRRREELSREWKKKQPGKHPPTADDRFSHNSSQKKRKTKETESKLRRKGEGLTCREGVTVKIQRGRCRGYWQVSCKEVLLPVKRNLMTIPRCRISPVSCRLVRKGTQSSSQKMTCWEGERRR